MSGSNPTTPNLPDFLLFIQNNMKIPLAALPASSTWPSYAFGRAMSRVIQAPTVDPVEYVQAVYNCAAHLLLTAAPDQTGQTWFQQARQATGLLSPRSGVIQSSSDQGTSNSFLVPDAFAGLTIGDLQFYQTFYGREYLAYSQDFGGPFGIT